MDNDKLDDIAIIGFDGVFPGAEDIETFWSLLKEGKELIETFDEEELKQVNSKHRANKNYVPRKGIIKNSEYFDTEFFNISPREAELIDPQHRLLLKYVWRGLEDALCDPYTYEGKISLFCSSSPSSYFLENLFKRKDIGNEFSDFHFLGINQPDTLATRIAYKLNFAGPSLTIQSACSSSAASIYLACQNLATYDSDIAIAAAASIKFPICSGYLSEEGGILSPTGSCRPFDENADGTVDGDGVAAIVLKRLDDAINDNDNIRAVIKGVSCNNDGAQKMSFSAPSSVGQQDCISQAIANAGFSPDSIGYIETHGTGTNLGDPVEFMALKAIYDKGSEPCYLGSVKANIGHLDVVAGLVGLIKTVLVLEKKEIPPLAHFTQPNKTLKLDNCRLTFNSELIDFKSDTPRRAALSSFGVGGTNVHIVLEEHIDVNEESNVNDPAECALLLVSAKNKNGLEKNESAIHEYLSKNENNIFDMAYSTQVGRAHFQYRSALLIGRDGKTSIDNIQQKSFVKHRDIILVFAGQGEQHLRWSAEQYKRDKIFKRVFDSCCDTIGKYGDVDLYRYITLDDDKELPKLECELSQTHITQPYLFATQYSYAMSLVERGIKPVAFLGHSLGEYIAACMAGIMSRDDALKIVIKRGHLIGQCPKGSMLSVHGQRQAIEKIIEGIPVVFSSINSPTQLVLSGSEKDIFSCEAILTKQQYSCKVLHTSHAFHSPLIEPIKETFRHYLESFQFHPAKAKLICDLNGVILVEGQELSLDYWLAHLCQPVDFKSCIEQIRIQFSDPLVIDLGARGNLTKIIKSNIASFEGAVVDMPILNASNSTDVTISADSLHSCFYDLMAQVWCYGGDVDWKKYNSQLSKRRKVSLPHYCFDERRYFIEKESGESETSTDGKLCKNDFKQWFYRGVWSEAALPSFVDLDSTRKKILLIGDQSPLHFYASSLFSGSDYLLSTLALSELDQVSAKELLEAVDLENIIITFGLNEHVELGVHLFRLIQFYKLIFSRLEVSKHSVRITLVTNDIHAFLSRSHTNENHIELISFCKVVKKELANVSTMLLEFPNDLPTKEHARTVLYDILCNQKDDYIVYRERKRWVKTYQEININKPNYTVLREQGVYLITGGLGGIGFVLAKYLMENYQATVIIAYRTPWDNKQSAQHALYSERVEKLKSLSVNATFYLYQCDISIEKEVLALVGKISTNHGAFNGVIHAAGIAGEGIVALKEKKAIDNVFSAKVIGFKNLLKALSGCALDFILSCSSLSAFIGEFGQVDYSAANLFLDVYAENSVVSDVAPMKLITVNWGAWSEIGMAYNYRNNTVSEELETGINNEEGIKAFEVALELGLPNVIVSPVSIAAVIDRANSMNISSSSARVVDNETEYYSRPSLETEFLEPQTHVAKVLSGLWSRVLGVKNVGLNDNFHDLGGDSLSAIKLVQDINKALDVTLCLVHENMPLH